MLRVIIYAVLIGQSYGGVLQTMRNVQYMVDVGGILPLPVSDAEEKFKQDGIVPTNFTGTVETVPENEIQSDGAVPKGFVHAHKFQETRHVSMRIKSLTKRYKKKCRDRNRKTAKCAILLQKIVYAHSDVKKKHFPREFNPIDFLMCMDDQGYIHEFDPDTQICCNGIFNKTSDTEECCRGDIIDSRYQFCCNGQIQNRTEWSKCCGTYTYDERTQTCCNGYLYSKLQGSQCCGDVAYNKDEQICCFNKYRFDVSQGDACCGTQVYNSSTQTCCETSTQPIYGRKNRKGKCCRDKSYHIECFKCENGAILPVFNESTEVCCEGTIKTKKYGEKTGCCRRKAMDTGSQMCDKNRGIVDLPPGMPIVTANLSGGTSTISASTTEYEHLDESPAQDQNNYIFIISVGVAATLATAVVLVAVLIWHRKRKLSMPDKLKKQSYVHQSLNNYNVTNNPIHQMNHQNAIEVLPEIQVLRDDNVQIPDDSTLQFLSKDENSVSNIAKSDATPKENILTNHYKNSYTQTSPEKESNRRTVFGKPFEYHFILGMSNGTAKMPNSDVKMTLPQSILRKNQVEVNCTTFRMVPPLMIKFGLSSDEIIASPVAEYALTGYGQLPDYAVVVMPFLGSPADLMVRKFQSDEGLNTVVQSVDVPLQGKTNEDADVFYIVKDSDVYIYTKSFSGFYCTTCRHRPLSLRCFLFGSYKRFTNPLRHEVRLSIYLADDLMKFADYKERMFTNEAVDGRVLKREMQLRLPSELTETDLIQASVTPTESHFHQWVHKLYPGESTPIYDEKQTLELISVAEKCKNCEFCHLSEHEVPHCIEWYLTNVDGVIPNYTFQCIIDVDVIRVSDNTKTTNRVVIDELQLRQEDRYPIEEQFNARNVQGVKEYLSAGMSADKRAAVLGSLLSKYRCTGTSVEEVFFKLQEKLTPKYLLEAVAAVMKEKHMFTELDVLQAYGFLPRNLISNDVQPVSQDVHDIAEQEGQIDGNGHGIVHQSNSNENMPNGFESPISHVEDDVYQCTAVTVRRPNPTQQGAEPLKESLELVKEKPSHASTERTNVRRELSRSHPMGSFSKNMGDVTLTEAHAVPETRGELSTPAVDSKSEQESLNPHVQERASLDDTFLKRTNSKD